MPLPVLVIIIVISALVLFALLPYLLIAHYIYKDAFYNKVKEDNAKSSFLSGKQYLLYEEEIKSNKAFANEVPFKEVYIKDFKNKDNLYGRIYRFNDSNKVQIQFHGYKGSGRRDMCGFLRSAKENDLNAIVVDMRGHGKSDGNIVSFGINERKDVLKWIELAKQEFGEDAQILLKGLSMGAATVLMSLDQNLPSNVKCVIADCPFSAPKDELLKVALEEKTKMPPKLALFFLRTAARIFGHFSLVESSAVEAVRNSKIPVLLIHGTGDKFVPYSMSTKIYEANKEMVEFISIENAGHALCTFVDKDKYQKATTEFINKHVK